MPFSLAVSHIADLPTQRPHLHRVAEQREADEEPPVSVM
jgi:hypothetical protein